MIGVYSLKQNDKVVYVGQSINIERRLKEHAKTKKFNGYSAIECSKDLLNTTEEALILRHNPLLNIKKAEIKTSGKIESKLPKTKKVSRFIKSKQHRITIVSDVKSFVKQYKKSSKDNTKLKYHLNIILAYLGA